MLDKLTAFFKAFGAVILAVGAALLIALNWKAIKGVPRTVPEKLPDVKATDHVAAANKEVSDAGKKVDSSSDDELASSINSRYGSNSHS